MIDFKESVKRLDFEDKITGKALFTSDLRPDELYYCKVYRSERQRARILSISYPDLQDEIFIVDYHDIPGKNRVPIVYDDQPFLAEEEVNYIGEPILLIIGRDKNIIQDIADSIKIDYEDIESVNSIEEALADPRKYHFADDVSAIEYSFHKGDPEKYFDSTFKILQDTLETGYQEHAYLETHSFQTDFNDGVIEVRGSMQCPYYVVESIKAALDLSEENIRVIQQPTGGGFGGKEDYPSIPAALCALASLKSGKPVQLVYDRKEDIVASTKRHPSIITIRSSLDDNNRIKAMDIEVKLDAGAYAGLSSVVLQRTIFSATGAYNIENLRVHGAAYATNKVVSSAFRGFGGPQAMFAIEMHMENIALKFGIDPYDFKKAHLLRDGDLSATQGSYPSKIKLHEIAEQIEEMAGYKEKRINRNNDGKYYTGFGFSIFFHGCGFTGAGEAELIKPKVKLNKYKTGEVEIFASSAEIGQGVQTTLRKIVAAELGIPIEMVKNSYPDTKYSPDSGPTVASRTILIVGRLLQDCAKEMKARLNEDEFEIMRSYIYPKELSWDNDRFIGNAYPESSWGANVVELQVDKVTYEAEIKNIWAVYDIGTPIDPRIVQGQIEGGISQGLGFSLMENFKVVKGEPMQKSFTTYIIPSSTDFPRPHIKLIDNPRGTGPFGASGLGEVPLVGVAPAVASALQDAIKKSINRVPVTPEYLKELMRDEN